MDVSRLEGAIALQNAFGFILESEVKELDRLTLILPVAPVIINIGAGPGTSAMTFIESRPDSEVYTVDVQAESHPLGSLGGEREAMVNAGHGPLDGLRWHQIHGDSKAMASEWRGGGVDLVFVDGDHSYEGCAGDIEGWLPHLDGYMVVHDYDKSGQRERTGGESQWRHIPRGRIFINTIDVAVDELLRPHFEMISLVGNMITFRIKNGHRRTAK